MSARPAAAELAAKDMIRHTLYLYCRSMDQIDRALGLSLWAPEATVDYGPTIFQGTAVDFIERVSRHHEQTEARSHQVTNILIDLDLPQGRASTEAYVTAALRDAREGVRKDRLIRGRYLDDWVQHEGRWVIAHRRFQHDLTSLLPSP